MKIIHSLGTLLLTSLLLLVSISCKKSESASGGTETDKGTERTVTVRILEIQPLSFHETIQLSGTIKAFDDVMLSPEEGGTVKEWKYEKGESVRRGEIIALLNDDMLRPSYEAAQAQYNLTEMNAQKQEKVYSEQAVSELQFKTSVYQRDGAKAQADLMKARWDHARVKSPIDGILDDRYKSAGEIAAPGMPLAHIININSVKLQINVPERYAGTVLPGTPVTLAVVAYPEDIFSGKVKYVGASLSADNRTFPVEVVISNPNRRLKPEMIARVTLQRAARDNALIVQEDVVQQVDKDRLVVYVENGGRAREHAVQIGGREGNTVEIIAGLNGGERVIVSGYKGLVDGQAVEVVQDTTDTKAR